MADDRTQRTRSRARATPTAEELLGRVPHGADWAPYFLAQLERAGMVSEAAKLAGIGRRTAYDRRERDPEFRRAWDDVVERTTEVMERAAYQRAVAGTLKPVFQGGQQVGTIREYSDTLLIFMLKSRRPDVYRERVEHTGAGGGPLEHRVRLNLAGLSEDQLAALEAIQPDADSADPE